VRENASPIKKTVTGSGEKVVKLQKLLFKLCLRDSYRKAGYSHVEFECGIVSVRQNLDWKIGMDYILLFSEGVVRGDVVARGASVPKLLRRMTQSQIDGLFDVSSCIIPTIPKGVEVLVDMRKSPDK